MRKMEWPAMKLRGRRWLPLAAIVLIAHALAGFWLAPHLLRVQLPKLAQQELACQASVGAVAFNPYTLRLTLQDLTLTEKGGAPLAALGQLTVKLEWSSLLKGAWNISEIRLSAPQLNVRVAADGEVNLSRLLASRRPAAATSAPLVLPRLTIDELVLERGKVSLHDAQAGYRNEFAPIDFTVKGLSTLAQHDSSYSFTAASARGGTLRWKGSASLNPIRGSGELVLDQLPLEQLAVYLPRDSGMRVSSGRLAATLPYRYSYGAGKLMAGLERARLMLEHAELAIGAADTPVRVAASKARLQLQLDFEHAAGGSNLQVRHADLAIKDLTLRSEGQSPVQLARLDASNGHLDLAARRAALGKLEAEGGQLQLVRDHEGQVNLLRMLSLMAPDRAKEAAQDSGRPAPWQVSVGKVAVRRFSAELADESTKVRVHLQDMALDLEGVGTDLKQPVRFGASLALREGGTLRAQGRVVPAGPALRSELEIRQLALSPLQPLLDRYVRLRMAGGNLSAKGTLSTGPQGRRNAALNYAGSLAVESLALTEGDGKLFAGWKEVSASQISASMKPNRLTVAELRIVEPSAQLHIDADRSFNAGRLRVQPTTTIDTAPPPATPPETQNTAPAEEIEPLQVRVRRVRLYNGKLDFSDLSLKPPFAAKIHELSGMINGLSTQREARSQIELDGRVDDYGLARLRGELKPFAPGDNTRLHIVFQNVDLVSSSPYMAKFLGYQVTDGKISLDLEYKVHNGQLEGNNQIVIDRLTLGDQVDSPDAIQMPLDLVLAMLKDSEDRIDIDLPVSGNTRSPEFSYGGVIWQALRQFVGKIVSSPVRALGQLLGADGAELQAIQFDPGSARLLPPEREKLKRVAQLLAQRSQLRLSVPGQYNEGADGSALRVRAMRLAVAQRAGVALETGEEAGPPNLADRAVRKALRELYAERLGAPALEQQKQAAEQAVPSGQAGDKLPMWQRMARLAQGEPQVANIRPFYRKLEEALERSTPLAADALAALGAQRARAIADALQAEGVDAVNVTTPGPETTSIESATVVPLKLGLVSR